MPTIRRAKQSDAGFVLRMWSKDSHEKLKATFSWSRQGRVPLFSLYNQLFRQIQMKISGISECFVAANPEDDNQLFGFLLCRRGDVPIVFYVYTKPEFRRMGIAKHLLEHARISAEKHAIYAFGTALFLIPEAWTHVPWYLMPEIYRGKAA